MQKQAAAEPVRPGPAAEPVRPGPAAEPVRPGHVFQWFLAVAEDNLKQKGKIKLHQNDHLLDSFYPAVVW